MYKYRKKILRLILGIPFLTYNMRNFILRRMGVIIGDNVAISKNFTLADRAIDRNLLKIGNNVDIAGNVSVLTSSGPVRTKIKDIYPITVQPVEICDDVWIGMNAIILNGVTIGKCSIVGAGCVVDKDVPPYSVAKGNPMIVKKMPKILIEKLKNK